MYKNTCNIERVSRTHGINRKVRFIGRAAFQTARGAAEKCTDRIKQKIPVEQPALQNRLFGRHYLDYKKGKRKNEQRIL